MIEVRLLEQLFPMSSALWASARSLGFLMGYYIGCNAFNGSYTNVVIFEILNIIRSRFLLLLLQVLFARLLGNTAGKSGGVSV